MNRPVTLRAKHVFICLFSIAAFFLITFMSLVILVPDYDASVRTGVLALFNVNAEVSIPTWYSQTILIAAAALLAVIAKQAKSYRRHWAGLAVLFLYISIDEGASIHELTSSPMKQLIGVQSGPLYYSWIVLFATISLIIALLYLKFLKHLPKRYQYLIVMSAAVLLAGGIGTEMVGAHLAAETGEHGVLYALAAGIEEFLEMTGVILFIYTLVSYMREHNIRPSVKIT